MPWQYPTWLDHENMQILVTCKASSIFVPWNMHHYYLVHWTADLISYFSSWLETCADSIDANQFVAMSNMHFVSIRRLSTTSNEKTPAKSLLMESSWWAESLYKYVIQRKLDWSWRIPLFLEFHRISVAAERTNYICDGKNHNEKLCL